MMARLHGLKLIVPRAAFYHTSYRALIARCNHVYNIATHWRGARDVLNDWSSESLRSDCTLSGGQQGNQDLKMIEQSFNASMLSNAADLNTH